MLDACAPRHGLAPAPRPPVAATTARRLRRGPRLRPRRSGRPPAPRPSPRPPHARPRRRVWRRRLALAAVGLLALGAAGVLRSNWTRSRRPPTNPVATHHATRPQTRRSPVRARHPRPTPRARPFRRSPRRWRTEGSPETAPLARALEATAAQPAGAGREAAAQQALLLAGVLLDGGGITSGQYQDVVTVLQPTGATVTTTTRRRQRHRTCRSRSKRRSSGVMTTAGTTGAEAARVSRPFCSDNLHSASRRPRGYAASPKEK